MAFAAGALSAVARAAGSRGHRRRGARLRFADIVRQEYLAVGVRAPCTRRSTSRPSPAGRAQLQTFGQDASTARRTRRRVPRGCRASSSGPDGVACTTKHFPGGGPQKDGEDPHFAYGREQVYPGGRFEEHLEPFRAAIAAGTSGIMPYYGMPVGLSSTGSGRGGRLRLQPADRHRPAPRGARLRRHRLHRLGPGHRRRDLRPAASPPAPGASSTCPRRADGSGSSRPVRPVRRRGVPRPACSSCAHRAGREARLDESARRLLRTSSCSACSTTRTSTRTRPSAWWAPPAFRAAGHRAQAEAVTVLSNDAVLPLPGGAAYCTSKASTPDVAGATARW